MTPQWHVVIHLLRLARLELVLGAVSNAWLIVWLGALIEPAGRQPEWLADGPLIVSLLLSLVIAVGLGASGILLNDVVDARYDRTFSPQRPIPSGHVSARTAVIAGLVCLFAGAGAAVWFGPSAVLIYLLTASGILFYNTTWKYLPAAGVVTMAAIRVLFMAIPNPHMSFGWPLWLVGVHVIVCGALVHALTGKRPRFGEGTVWRFVVAGTLLTGVAIWAMQRRGGLGLDLSLTQIAPVIAAAGLMAVFAWFGVRPLMWPLRRRREAGVRLARLAILWLIVFDVAWLAGAGLWAPAFIHLGLLGLALAMKPLLGAVALLTAPPPRFRMVSMRALTPASKG